MTSSNKTTIKNQILKREKGLRADYDALSPHDISIIIKYCFGSTDFVDNLIVASLFSGRPIARLLNIVIEERHISNHPFAVLPSDYKHPIPKLGEPNSAPFIFLPKQIVKVLKACQAERPENKQLLEVWIENWIDAVKKRLKELNKRYKCRLTTNRISTTLSQCANQFSLSQAEVTFISGNTYSDHAGRYYLKIKAGLLAYKHYEYINHLFRLAQKSALPVQQLGSHTQHDVYIGSNFAPNDECIKQWFQYLTGNIESYKKAFPAQYFQLFNYYSSYTLCVLLMCTGQRNNNILFSNIDLYRMCVFISDKNCRENASRVIPLSKTVQKQLIAYFDFVDRFASYIERTDPISAEMLKALKCSSKPIFYNFRSCGTLQEFIYPRHIPVNSFKAKTKSNWYRHWLKSTLTKAEKINPECIDAIMGHENKLDESFSKFSCFSLNDLQPCARAIDDELALLGIEALEFEV